MTILLASKKNALQVLRRERESTNLLLHHQSHLQIWEQVPLRARHPATGRPYEFASAELDAIKKRNLDRRGIRQRSAEWDWTAVLVPGLMGLEIGWG
jgi:hypothetical protein